MTNDQFKENDMEVIAAANQKVVLTKHAAGVSETAVSWTSFKPWQKDTVDWENVFAVYASSSEVQSGETIHKL